MRNLKLCILARNSHCSPVAQLAEQAAVNRWVVGSNPTGGAIFNYLEDFLLYIVATPIGNLGDLTYRAVSVLSSVDIVIAENPKKASILLSHYRIDVKTLSYHAKSSRVHLNRLIVMLESGLNLAYISEAGTPSISDPGYFLVKLAREKGIEISPIPGPSAFVTLLSVASSYYIPFVFHGFLPHKKGRKKKLELIAKSEETHIFYESVHRFSKLIDELIAYLGENKKIVVGKELTKIYECIYEGSLSEVKLFFVGSRLKGEFVVIIPSLKLK